MPLLTARELAAELKVNADEVYRNAAAGKIPSYKFGKSRRFNLAEVLAASRDESMHRELGPVRRLARTGTRLTPVRRSAQEEGV